MTPEEMLYEFEEVNANIWKSTRWILETECLRRSEGLAKGSVKKGIENGLVNFVVTMELITEKKSFKKVITPAYAVFKWFAEWSKIKGLVFWEYYTDNRWKKIELEVIVCLENLRSLPHRSYHPKTCSTTGWGYDCGVSHYLWSFSAEHFRFPDYIL